MFENGNPWKLCASKIWTYMVLFKCLKNYATPLRSWEKQTRNFWFCYPSLCITQKRLGRIGTFYTLNESSTIGEVPFLGQSFMRATDGELKPKICIMVAFLDAILVCTFTHNLQIIGRRLAFYTQTTPLLQEMSFLTLKLHASFDWRATCTFPNMHHWVLFCTTFTCTCNLQSIGHILAFSIPNNFSTIANVSFRLWTPC